MSYFTMSPFGQELNSKKGVDKIKDVYEVPTGIASQAKLHLKQDCLD